MIEKTIEYVCKTGTFQVMVTSITPFAIWGYYKAKGYKRPVKACFPFSDLISLKVVKDV